jgi:hypothetical protein
MLFRETTAVHCKNNMERINTLCWQAAEFEKGLIQQLGVLSGQVSFEKDHFS